MEQLEHEVAAPAEAHQRCREGECLGHHLPAARSPAGRRRRTGRGSRARSRRGSRRARAPGVRSGNSTGTKRPPSAAVPPSSASASGRSSRPPRVLVTFTRAASPPGAATGEIHTSQSMPAARNACSIARAIRSARSRVHQAKMLGPPPEMLAPSAPSSSAAAFTGANPRMSGARSGSTSTSRSPARMDSRSPRKHPARTRARLPLCSTNRGSSKGRSSTPREVRVSRTWCGCTSTQVSPSGTGIGTSRSCVASARPPRSIGPDVVAVLGSARRGLSDERAAVEHVHRRRPLQQRARRQQGRDAGGGRSSHSRPQWDPLLDAQGEAVGEPEAVPQRQERPAGGVPLRLQRQSAHHPLDPEDAHLRRIDVLDRDPVDRTHDGVTEHVESHTDIAHRGRCDAGRAGTIHAPEA